VSIFSCESFCGTLIDTRPPSFAAEIGGIRRLMDDEGCMEKRVAVNLAVLRRRRSAVLSLIRALEEYSNATRCGVSPRRNVRYKRAR
jgi:hypothetical protein